MASIKTIVRELGIIYWIDRILGDEVIEPKKVKPDEFYNRCSGVMSSEIEEADKIRGKENFRSNKLQILENTYWLSKRIILNLDIKEIKNAKWIGPDTQSEVPADIILNDKRISLKEDSDILENMGLYKLIKLLTNSGHGKSKWSIFEDFAPKKYEEWFKFTWGLLLEESQETGKVWSDKSEDETRKIIAKEDKLSLIYQNREIDLPKRTISYQEYFDNTISDVREKVFAKWLKNYLQNKIEDEDENKYYHLKKECAETAGRKLKEHLEENLEIRYENLLRLLQVYDRDYYYAKAANGEVKIFYVPSIEDYEREDLEVVDFNSSVSESQLNFITTIKNRETGRKLKTRNEIRFSHGQFNGTPEAKMYKVKGYELSAVYRQVDSFDYSDNSISSSLTDFI